MVDIFKQKLLALSHADDYAKNGGGHDDDTQRDIPGHRRRTVHKKTDRSKDNEADSTTRQPERFFLMRHDRNKDAGNEKE